MASALLRTSARRRGGAFFHGVFSAGAAAATYSGGEGLAVRRGASVAPSHVRRPQHSGAQVEAPKSLDDRVKLLHQTIKDVNRKMELGHALYASIQRLAEDKEPHNPYIQWLWHVCALIGIIPYVQDRRGSATKDN